MSEATPTDVSRNLFFEQGMDSLPALVFAASVARAADAVEATQANAPQLLLDDVHDGRAIFAWSMDYVDKVPLDEDGR